MEHNKFMEQRSHCNSPLQQSKDPLKVQPNSVLSLSVSLSLLSLSNHVTKTKCQLLSLLLLSFNKRPANRNTLSARDLLNGEDADSNRRRQATTRLGAGQQRHLEGQQETFNGK